MFFKTEEGQIALFFIIGFAVILTCVALAACGVLSDNSEVEIGNYAMTAVVTKVDRANDIVTIEDCTGNEWQFYGVEDWELYDCASVFMCDNGTPQISDDTIVSVRYNSWEILGE